VRLGHLSTALTIMQLYMMPELCTKSVFPDVGVLIKEQKEDLIRSYNKDKQNNGPYRSVIYLI
jgi:hypothetical protein